MRSLMFATLVALGVGQSVHAADEVMVQRPVPFNEDADIAGAVKRECKLDEQLPDFIAEYGKEKGIEIDLVPQVAASHAGRVLVLEITDAVSDGNAFPGHRKSVSVKGKLYQEGQLLGSFKARRNSMGGAFDEFRGSCSVLCDAVRELGEDVAG
jgi:hypothetical protein